MVSQQIRSYSEQKISRMIFAFGLESSSDHPEEGVLKEIVGQGVAACGAGEIAPQGSGGSGVDVAKSGLVHGCPLLRLGSGGARDFGHRYRSNSAHRP